MDPSNGPNLLNMDLRPRQQGPWRGVGSFHPTDGIPVLVPYSSSCSRVSHGTNSNDTCDFRPFGPHCALIQVKPDGLLRFTRSAVDRFFTEGRVPRRKDQRPWNHESGSIGKTNGPARYTGCRTLTNGARALIKPSSCPRKEVQFACPVLDQFNSLNP